MSPAKNKIKFGKIFYLFLITVSFKSIQAQDTPPPLAHNKVYASGNSSYRIEDGKLEVFDQEEIDCLQTRIANSEISKMKIKAISLGNGHVMVLTQNGEVFTTGNNTSGQLGNSNAIYDPTFKLVAGLPKIEQISAGSFHCLALDYEGNVFSWGNNLVGQLGIGTTMNMAIPVKVVMESRIVYLDAGLHHNLAVDNNGQVWAWGRNVHGELGDGTYSQRLQPVLIETPKPVITVSASSSSIALLSDSTLLSWGNNEFGQLGVDTVKKVNRPIRVPGISSVVQISSGNFHSVVLDRLGNVWSWGRNNKGQLSDGSTNDRKFPAKISSGCLFVSSGDYHNLIIKSDHTIWVSGESMLADVLEAYVGDPYKLYRVDPLMYPNETLKLNIE